VDVTQLLVVRHGQSEWNAVGRWHGHADEEL
jgi:broad specificity phosphatase PhoE